MREALNEPSHTILVVDDRVENVTVVSAHLKVQGYSTIAGYNGIEAIALAVQNQPNLILLDVDMPGMDGLTACGKLKRDPRTSHIPIILVTAQAETEDIVRGLEEGADDYLSKPYRPMELLARVRSMLRIHDTQAELRRVNLELDDLNSMLEERVLIQVEELEKANRLRRFFSPQLVDGILSENPDILKEHRREITIVFLDLRNFTSFTEFATPQEVIATIRELHTLVGPIIFKYRGTLERFTGDGMMVFLGDPEPMADHAYQAAKMALEIRDHVELLRSNWSKKGYDLALGIGLASGEASLGTIGFEGRRDYAAIGVPTNLAARLCGKAAGGQILLSQRCHELIEGQMEAFPVGAIDLKGFSLSHAVYELIG
ncbi:MAG TPA: adenylate/guanylate cyclase domain-containing response regulator [Lentisphaeria bacterium]|nr:adenylate/guanylate cyclase domain-containing response regulator [Lentisphaeria bacterium]